MDDMAVKDFMQRYCAAFRPGNVERVATFYRQPMTMIQNGRVTVFDTRQSLVTAFTALLDALVARGFTGSDIDRMAIAAVAHDVFFVSAGFTRRGAGGSVLERVGATYTLLRDACDFKIAAVVAHDADRVLAFASGDNTYSAPINLQLSNSD